MTTLNPAIFYPADFCNDMFVAWRNLTYLKPGHISNLSSSEFHFQVQRRYRLIFFSFLQVMESRPLMTIHQKIDMIERCVRKNPIRQDTDPEFWNPRFNPTPESQKQETLIDDRWTRERKF